MKPKQIKRIASSEVDKLAAIKKCRAHEWEGPFQEVRWGDSIKYMYRCKHCPLAKLFDEAKET